MEKLKKALSALVLLLVGSAIPAQIGAMVSGSNTYEDNCGNSGSVTVTKGPVVGGAQSYHVVLNAKDWAGAPFIVEQTMVAGIPAQGAGN